jgi:hypothetical protein
MPKPKPIDYLDDSWTVRVRIEPCYSRKLVFARHNLARALALSHTMSVFFKSF